MPAARAHIQLDTGPANDQGPAPLQAVEAILYASQGYPGYGRQILFTDYSHAANYALVVRNQGAGGLAVQALASDGTNRLLVKDSGVEVVGNLSTSGNATIGGTLGVTGATTLSTLSTSGNASIGGTLGVTGATSLSTLSTSGNATVGGTLGVTGATTLSTLSTSGNASIGGTLNVTGGTTLSTLGVTGNVSVTGSATVNGTLNVAVLAVTGNIGFFGGSQVAKAASWTQNYSTTRRTIDSLVSSTPGSYSGIDNAQGGSPYARVTDLNNLRSEFGLLRDDVRDVKQNLNSILADLRAYGLEP